MIKKTIYLLSMILILTSCSNKITYKYSETESPSGNWIVENGSISVSEGNDSIYFSIKYNGDVPIEKGESWRCELLVSGDNQEGSVDTADVIYSRIDIDAIAMDAGDKKVFETNNDVIDIENNYSFKTVYLKIEYTINKEQHVEIIELSLKN